MNALRRQVEFTPAWDKRAPEPNKNYGIHCVELRMYVVGDEGAVQFVLYTGWDLPEVADELQERFPQRRNGPTPADLGYHSKHPMYEGQEPMPDCHLLNCPCYYDGSGLNADPIFHVLLREGSEGVWRELESYYQECFPLREMTRAEEAEQANLRG